MNLIVGLITITLFYILFANIIKKYPILFYMATYILIIPIVLYYQTKFYKNMPIWFTKYIMDIFKRGIFSTVTFMIVMFLGVITTHNKYTRKLMSIRGEMSIIGCFAAICHNVQKLAYPFFYLIYVHLMILFMIKPEKHMLSIVLYTVIYMLYTILRVRKYFVTKNKQK